MPVLNDKTDDDNEKVLELEDFLEHPSETEAPKNAFVTCGNVIAMISDEARMYSRF